MILYFSANGNSRWVARQLANATCDRIYDLSEYSRDFSSTLCHEISKSSVLGVVFPVHSWRAPAMVLRFLANIPPVACQYRYAVCTCGDDAGRTMNHLSRYFCPHAAWSVIMPNTYIPMFPLDDDALAIRKVMEARKRITAIATCVKARNKRWDVYEGRFPWLKTYLVHPIFTRFMVSSHGFFVDAGCVSCGTCIKACPVANIIQKDGQLQWGKACIHCMACIHSCPKQVIQYRKTTQKRGRYCLENYL